MTTSDEQPVAWKSKMDEIWKKRSSDDYFLDSPVHYLVLDYDAFASVSNEIASAASARVENARKLADQLCDWVVNYTGDTYPENIGELMDMLLIELDTITKENKCGS